jgi:heat shock protein HslJ
MLEDTYWKLLQIDGQPVRAVPDGREQHLVLFGGRANAHTGCNKLLASYARPGPGALRFGAPGSTRMACPDAYANQEIAYLKALAATTRYRIDGQHLLLEDDAGVRLRYEAREIR